MNINNDNLLNYNTIKKEVEKSSIRKPPYYHRQFEHDIGDVGLKSQLFDQTKRVALVALPFLCLYQPCGEIVSLAMDTMRCITCISQVNLNSKKELAYSLLNTAFAVAALGCNIFSHPSALLITTIHDLGININSLILAINEKKSKEAFEITGKIINNLLYLALFSTGSLEILVISILSQILLGAYSSYDEFKNDHYLEALGHLLITGIRCHQLAPQLQALQSKWSLSTPTMLNQISSTYEVNEQLTDEQLLKKGEEEGNQELVDIILKYRKDGYDPALYNALNKQDYKASEILIHNHAKVEYPVRPVLDIVLSNPNVPYNIVKQLITKGARVNYDTFDPYRLDLPNFALNHAVDALRVDLVELLIQSGVNVNRITYQYGHPIRQHRPIFLQDVATPLDVPVLLHLVISNNRNPNKFAIMKLLIEGGANTELVHTLHYATMRAHIYDGIRGQAEELEVVRLMLKNGGNMMKSRNIKPRMWVTSRHGGHWTLPVFESPYDYAKKHLAENPKLFDLLNEFSSPVR